MISGQLLPLRTLIGCVFFATNSFSAAAASDAFDLSQVNALATSNASASGERGETEVFVPRLSVKRLALLPVEHPTSLAFTNPHGFAYTDRNSYVYFPEGVSVSARRNRQWIENNSSKPSIEGTMFVRASRLYLWVREQNDEVLTLRCQQHSNLQEIGFSQDVAALSQSEVPIEIIESGSEVCVVSKSRAVVYGLKGDLCGRVLHIEYSPMRAVDYCEKNKTIAISRETVTFHQLMDHGDRNRIELGSHSDKVAIYNHIKFTPDGQGVIAAGVCLPDGKQQLFSWCDYASTKQPLASEEINSGIRFLVMSPDGSMVIHANGDRRVFIRRSADFAVLSVIDVKSEVCCDISISSNGDRIAVGTSGGIELFELSVANKEGIPVINR